MLYELKKKNKSHKDKQKATKNRIKWKFILKQEVTNSEARLFPIPKFIGDKKIKIMLNLCPCSNFHINRLYHSKCFFIKTNEVDEKFHAVSKQAAFDDK